MPGYHTKYDETNGGTQYVFDNFYQRMRNSNIKANLVACPGKDVDRYIRYASMICRTPLARAYFVENSDDHLALIKDKLRASNNKMVKRIRVLKGDAVTHESIGGPRVARVEDIGFGVGIQSMVYHGMVRLYRQSRAAAGGSAYNRYKVQIMDSCTRGVPPEEWYSLFQQYLAVIDLKIKKVNGVLVEDHPEKFAKFSYAKPVYTYDGGNRGSCTVYQHNVELYPNKYEKAKLHLYSCINGSSMLQSMLVYK